MKAESKGGQKSVGPTDRPMSVGPSIALLSSTVSNFFRTRCHYEIIEVLGDVASYAEH